MLVQGIVQNLSGACVGASRQRHPARHRSFRRIHSCRGQQRTQGHAWKDWRSQGKGIPDTRHKAWARAGSPTLRCFCTCSVAQAALATLCVYGRSPTLEDFGRWRVAISSVPRVHGYPSSGERCGSTGVSFDTSRTRVECAKCHFTLQAHADESGSDSD